MLRSIIAIICILIALSVFPDFYPGYPIITGNGLQNTHYGGILTATAFMDSNFVIEQYCNKNISGALEKDNYLFIWDYNNHMEIYRSNNTDQVIHSMDLNDSILYVFYSKDIMIVQTQRQTEFFFMDSMQLTSIRSPFNLHVSDAAFVRDVICISANNGNMIINVSADSSGIELNDTLYAYGTDELIVNNFDILCGFRDKFIDYYIVTDSTIQLYETKAGGRDILGHRVINDMFYCWSSEYIYILDNNLVFNMDCIDSVNIDCSIVDIDTYNDRLHILSSNDKYYTSSADDLTITDTLHIADNILSVLSYGNDYLIWTDRGLKYLDTDTDSLFMYNDSLIPLYILWDHIITSDTAVYYMQNDSLHMMKLSELPVSVSHIDNDILYADADYNIYSNDSMIMGSMYPVVGISQYRGLITANGYYGFMKRDTTGSISWSTFNGSHCLFVDSAAGGILMATSDKMCITDTMLGMKSIYSASMKGLCRTDTMLYINTLNEIIAVDDSLTNVLYDDNYQGICMIALGDMNGSMLVKNNALIELNYEMTGFSDPISRSIDNNKYANYIVYDIMGRFRGLNNGQNTLRGVFFIRNGEETEKMINIQ